MADEAQPVEGQETDVKQDVASEEASTTETQETKVETPAEEGSVTEKAPETEKTVPYARFKEVIDKRNETESKLREIEERLAKQESFVEKKETQAKEDAMVAKFIKAGVEANTAKFLVESMREISSENVRQEIAPLAQQSTQREIDSWMDKFAQTHKDYNELEPEMTKAFKSLPETTQQLIASDPKGVELLYGYVKSTKLDEIAKSEFEKGRTEAYKSKQSKGAVSSVPSSTKPPKTALTEEAINAMSVKEFRERQDEIRAWMGSNKGE